MLKSSNDTAANLHVRVEPCMAHEMCVAALCGARTPEGLPAATAATHPLIGPVDITADDEKFIFRCDVPGLTNQNIAVRVVDGSLEICGSRCADLQYEPGTVCLRAERTSGSFCRRFKLPAFADPANVTALCEHGVLTVTVAKEAGTESPAPASGRDVNVESANTPWPSATGRGGGVRVDVVVCDEEGDGSLNGEFEKIPMSAFPRPAMHGGTVITVPSTMPLLDALNLLVDNDILAAPVLDPRAKPGTPWCEKYMGIVDVNSVVFEFLSVLKPEQPVDFWEEVNALRILKARTVADAFQVAPYGPFVPVDQDRGNLLDCMLLCGQHGARRVCAVESPGGDLTNIITQSALVQTLHANMWRFMVVGGKTLLQAGLGTAAHVVTVNVNAPLMAAFQLIKDNDVSAVPVVDDVGAIKGNISADDIRLVATSPKIYKLLRMPIAVFLDVVAEGVDNSAITVLPTATLDEVVATLVRKHIHRVYVVNPLTMVPLRVVALRDVVRKFVREPAGYFGKFFWFT